MLCKTLGIELTSLTPGSLLKEVKTFLPSFGATPASLGPKMGGPMGGALGGGGMGQLSKGGMGPDAFGPVPTAGAPPSLVPGQQGPRGLGTGGPMDPMAAMAMGGMGGPGAGPGASGAGLGAVLAGTPQQQG